jgi:hypothetical protein
MMAQERIHIDISNEPGLRALVDQVTATGNPAVLQVDSKDVAVLQPARKSKKRVRRILTEDHALFRLVGIGSSGIPGGISEHKHEALLRAKRGQ